MPEKSKVETYRDALVPLMSFVHNGRTFDKDRVFTQLELLEVTQDAGRATFMEKYYASIAFALMKTTSRPEY